MIESRQLGEKMISYLIGVMVCIAIFKYMTTTEEMAMYNSNDVVGLSFAIICWPMTLALIATMLGCATIFGVFYTFGILISTPVRQWNSVHERLWSDFLRSIK